MLVTVQVVYLVCKLQRFIGSTFLAWVSEWVPKTFNRFVLQLFSAGTKKMVFFQATLFGAHFWKYDKKIRSFFSHKLFASVDRWCVCLSKLFHSQNICQWAGAETLSCDSLPNHLETHITKQSISRGISFKMNPLVLNTVKSQMTNSTVL